MDLFSRDELAELTQVQSETCVTILMPTFHVEAELSQNPIRLKNLLRQARQELKDQGVRNVDALLAPIQGLLENNAFWLEQSDGLAIFRSPDYFRTFRLPLSFEETVVTSGRFHLKPLFPVIASNDRFYVLALSQQNVRLYRGTRYTISEVETTEIPKSITEALPFEVVEGTMRIQTRHAGNGTNQALYHGHGLDPADEKSEPHDELKRFFREVNNGLLETLKGEMAKGETAAPLVLAGVEYYLPLYRSVNGYRNLVDSTLVAGNPDLLKPKQLHHKAWSVLEPIFESSRRNALDNFAELRDRNTGLTTADLREIVPAAAFGQVDTLFAAAGVNVWGRYDADANTVTVHGDQQAGDECLLDLAAVHTFLNGGQVIVLPPEEMPDRAPLAARLRYPASVAATQR